MCDATNRVSNRVTDLLVSRVALVVVGRQELFYDVYLWEESIILLLVTIGPVRPGGPDLIRKGPAWVQVFIPVKQEPHLIFHLFNQLILAFNRLRCGFCIVGLKTCTTTGPSG